jgi:hypothetical protein
MYGITNIFFIYFSTKQSGGRTFITDNQSKRNIFLYKLFKGFCSISGVEGENGIFDQKVKVLAREST